MGPETYIQLEVLHQLAGDGGSFQLELNLSIGPSEIIAITGPSGAGKSSLLRILAGLLAADQAYIEVGGQVWQHTQKKRMLQPQKRSIGMVFQDYALFPHMSLWENLRFALPKGSSTDWPEALLKKVQLWELRDQLPGQISGGQQQRVALIRALVPKPKVLLLDEPLSALDLQLRKQLQDDLKFFQQDMQLSIFWVSHSLIEISRVADRVLVLEKGKAVQFAPPEEVFKDQSHALLEGEVLKVLGNQEYWLNIGNNAYRLRLDQTLEVGDSIRLDPKIILTDPSNNA